MQIMHEALVKAEDKEIRRRNALRKKEIRELHKQIDALQKKIKVLENHMELTHKERAEKMAETLRVGNARVLRLDDVNLGGDDISDSAKLKDIPIVEM